MTPLDLQKGALDLNLADAGDYAEVTVRMPKHLTRDFITLLSNQPTLPIRSFSADNNMQTEKHTAPNSKKSEKFEEKNTFIVFPSEVLFKMVKFLYFSGISTLIAAFGWFMWDYYDWSLQTKVLTIVILFEVAVLFFLMRLGVSYYFSYLTHDTGGEVEIVTKKSLFRPSKITLASNVIRAVARYDKFFLSLFDVGKIEFYDASKNIDNEMFLVSEPKFWVKVYKLHA